MRRAYAGAILEQVTSEAQLHQVGRTGRIDARKGLLGEIGGRFEDGDWLPLGVFALTKPNQTKSDISIQLAVNKQGIVRGNYTDNVTNKNQVIQGSVDKQS